MFEIFGVQLTSANVLFQLEEIDDEEVREWTAQFTRQTTPSLLGGWYPTQMFLPLREIIRLRIAAMVGRSKAELETRRKRLDALKKQALSDYAEELAGARRSSSSKQKSTAGAASARKRAEAAAEEEEEEDEELAFERSLIQERNAAASNVEKLSAGAEADKSAEDEDEEDLDLQEEEDGDNDNSSAGRSRATYDEDEDIDDDEEDEEQEQAAADKQQKSKGTFAAEPEPARKKSAEFSF